MFSAKDIMSRHLITVSKNTPIFEAIEILSNNRISGMPVIDEDKLIGILSEFDVLELLTDKEFPFNKTVSDFMIKDVVSFDENDSVLDICDFFKKNNKRRVPILRGGKPVGIVSRHDVINLIVNIKKKVRK